MRLYAPPTAFFAEVQTFDPHSFDFPRARSGVIRRWFKAMVDMSYVKLFGTFLFVGAIFFFVFSFSVFLFSLPPHKAAAQGTAMSAPAVATGVPLFPSEMHIANNGLTLLRSARVVAVNGTTITVSAAWGSTDFRWIVLTDASSYETHNFGTRFLNRDGQEISPQNVLIGDYVTITGMLDTVAQEPTLNADSVRNLEE
ncbi:MAG: hypothetical protein ABSE76_00455 [Minisyncoccia bacterium]|jgi:hypothetical protein